MTLYLFSTNFKILALIVQPTSTLDFSLNGGGNSSYVFSWILDTISFTSIWPSNSRITSRICLPVLPWTSRMFSSMGRVLLAARQSHEQPFVLCLRAQFGNFSAAPCLMNSCIIGSIHITESSQGLHTTSLQICHWSVCTWQTHNCLKVFCKSWSTLWAYVLELHVGKG